MRAWAFLLGGLLVWTVHFFGSYAASSVFLDAPITRWLTGALTLLCLAVDAVLFRHAYAAYGREEDEARRWRALLATWAAAISFVSVLWQGLPALLT